MADGSAPRSKVPATEERGGDHPDWASARPGEELPELPGPVSATVDEFLGDPAGPGTRRER
jgi:hypothetical protein